MIDVIANGTWLHRRRVRAVSTIALVMTIVAMVAWLATASGTLDAFNRPLGTDFSMVWTSGAMANDGRAALAWHWPSLLAMQEATHGNVDHGFLAWLYPPPFLLVAAPLALLPYVTALVVYQLGTLACTLLVVRQIVPGRETLLVAAAYPAVFICLGHGHNGFLTATLLGGGLLLLDRRPFVAGLLIGCLIYKPQLGILLPLVLLAGWRWRAIAGATASASALIGLTLVLWGWPVWQAFIDSLPLTQAVIIEQGSTGWEKIQSAFAAIRMWGGSLALAYGVQAVVTLVALAGAVFATRRMNANVANAAIIAASLLSTPYLLDYDYVVLGVAIAFLVADARARGWLRWEQSLYAMAWATPLIGRTLAAATGIPLTLIVGIAIFAFAIRRGILLDDAARDIRLSVFRHAPVTADR